MIGGLLRNVPTEVRYLVRRLRGGASIDSVSVAEASVLLARGTPIVDVREPEEWRSGHIEGAVHIPLRELAERSAELPSGQLLTICRSGNRSVVAADILARQGRGARSVSGGMVAWAREGERVSR